MENATEALKMAAMVLMFIIALSVSVVAFSQARQTSDVILDYKDRETEYIDGDFYYKTTSTERNVGLETIMPTIARVYTESYKIIFEGLDNPIYTKRANAGQKEEDRYILDLEYDRQILQAGSSDIKIFYDAIVYGQVGEEFKRLYIEPKTISFDPEYCVYKQLKDKIAEGYIITEYSGVYYQEDLNQTQETETKEEVPDANKTKKRVITYKIEQEQ